jgi:hypothetical protein
MTEGGAAGFWSYAHKDDESARGGIRVLAADISAEYDLLTGRPLRIFVDRDSLVWGDNWKSRIDAGLADATFFIPVVTPRYFKRPECRREFVEFLAQSRSLGLEEFLLPILFVPVADLAVGSADELVASVARTQYVDWTMLRLSESSSGEYRAAVASLVRRLVDIESRLIQVQLDNERSYLSDDVDGMAELLSKIEPLLVDWINPVHVGGVISRQMEATMEAFMENEYKLKRSGAKSSAIFANRIRMGAELAPLQKRALAVSSVYSAKCIELDPLVTEAIRISNDYPAAAEALVPVSEAIDLAMENIAENMAEDLSGVSERSISEVLNEWSRISKVFHSWTEKTRNPTGWSSKATAS